MARHSFLNPGQNFLRGVHSDHRWILDPEQHVVVAACLVLSLAEDLLVRHNVDFFVEGLRYVMLLYSYSAQLKVTKRHAIDVTIMQLP